ncbi:hypothetical protein [Pseudobacteriovorax antillogorgiicola]|uniref:hypothetical protein n=1 Tax=Pseudobacteriovorax antillogorgiicola TaxID=1513793 RepID=UPI001045AE28|nr:hypothetical protein [Pseudobacteriovorax antillogorgiicola]
MKDTLKILIALIFVAIFYVILTRDEPSEKIEIQSKSQSESRQKNLSDTTVTESVKPLSDKKVTSRNEGISQEDLKDELKRKLDETTEFNQEDVDHIVENLFSESSDSWFVNLLSNFGFDPFDNPIMNGVFGLLPPVEPDKWQSCIVERSQAIDAREGSDACLTAISEEFLEVFLIENDDQITYETTVNSDIISDYALKARNRCKLDFVEVLHLYTSDCI